MTENKYKKEIAILLEKIEQPDAICIGAAAIGKFIGVIALLICVGLLFCYPLLAIIVGGSSGYNSYDDGYDSIYDDGDYDDYRYDRDSDYADGVDDAMDELGW